MKRIFKFITPVILVALVAFFAYEAGYIDVRQFPEAKGAKQITLNCDYRNQKIVINENLYQSVDEYYSSYNKKRRIGYESFVTSDPKDATIKSLTQKIKTKGTELGLTEDQTADLATCFVQNIPYDSDKAKVVLSTNPTDKVERVTNMEFSDRFPYETLYDNKGICTDKSYLEAAILREMGYGASLLTFDAEKHMAVGLETPKGYTSFNTEYSYVETTSPGYKVGQLPSIDKNTGGAKKAELDKISGTQGNELIPQFPESDFSAPSEIIKISDGKEYMRVIEITNEINRLQEIIATINSKNKNIATYQQDIKSQEQAVESAKSELAASEAEMTVKKNAYEQSSTEANYSIYKQVYNDYTSTYSRTKGSINSYNAKVATYNEAVKEMNSLIDEYNQLIKKD